MKTVALELQPCCGNRSGIGTYTYEIASRLKDDDDLHFCGNVFNFCGRNDNSEALKDIDISIIERHIFPYGVYRRIWNYIPFSYNSFFETKADLSIFFNYIVPPRIKGKTMTTIHDMAYMRFPETLDRKNLYRINKDIGYSVNRSDRILTVSNFSKREIMELLNVSENKISVLPCAAAITRETVDFDEFAVKHNFQKPYLFYVGTIEPRKNLVRLLKAFEIIKTRHRVPHTLVVAGGKGWGETEFYETLSRLNSKEDVKLIGYISIKEKSVLYQNADAFVFPSLYEGFGIPPLEAMQHGCPVVASEVASIPEVCGDAAIYVNPLDEESIAEGLLKVISNDESVKLLKERGFVQGRKYTWESSVEKLKNICKEVLL